MTLLKVRQLTAGYGGPPVVSDLDFEVDPGETIALLGVNGAGKTTTLRALSGLCRIEAGTMTFDDDDITGWPAHRRVAAGLVHVPESRHLFATLTVAENLAMGMHTFRSDRARTEAALERTLELFPVLRERIGQPAGTMSGGEQQMLAIARGLVANPKLLAIDEASFGLAPKIVDTVFEAVSRISATGIAVLLVEQNVNRSLEIADRAYVLEKGAVVYAGTPDELRSRDRLTTLLLGADA